MEHPRKHFRKRDAILNCLRGTDVHPSAEWIHEELKSDHSDISLATVYRNLALFKQQGLIQSLGTVNGTERFDGNTAPHVHFICTGCSRIMDLAGIQAPENLRTAVEFTTGGRVDICQLSFTGLCDQCLPKTNQ